MVLSRLLLARTFPLGEKATAITEPLCPSRVRTSGSAAAREYTQPTITRAASNAVTAGLRSMTDPPPSGDDRRSHRVILLPPPHVVKRFHGRSRASTSRRRACTPTSSHQPDQTWDLASVCLAASIQATARARATWAVAGSP